MRVIGPDPRRRRAGREHPGVGERRALSTGDERALARPAATVSPPRMVNSPPVGLGGADRPNVSQCRGAVLYSSDNCSALLLPMIWAGVWPMNCFSDRVRCGWSK